MKTAVDFLVKKFELDMIDQPNCSNIKKAKQIEKKQNKKILEDFIEFARNCGEDSYYIFETDSDAIDKFLKK